MVRSGVVNHPSDWPFCGYNEIQEPKRKSVLINYEKLTVLLGFNTYDDVKRYHERWVETFLEDGKNIRDDKWTKSIAVGSKSFVEEIKSVMGAKATGRKSTEAGESYQLREPATAYIGLLGDKKSHIGPENTYLWTDIQ